jgi:hypothetical protein
VRHVRMLGLCLVAALALGAYLTSSAMAGPQWVQCKAASELEAVGYPFEAKQVKYVDANCTEKNPKEARAYVLLKAPEVENLRLNYLGKETANVPFTGHSVGGGGILWTDLRECNPVTGYGIRTTRQKCAEEGYKESYNGGLEVECANEAATGETYSKNRLQNIHVKFTGCVVLGSNPCTGEGKASGEIETNTLEGKLGWINKSTKEVGVLLEPEQHHGTFAEFTCAAGGGTKVIVGAGNKKDGAEWVMGEKYPEGCWGAPGATSSCPGATPAEEKHGGYDGIISPITPVNQMTSEFTQVYSLESEEPYSNIPSHLEGKHLDVLEASSEVTLVEAHDMWSAAGEEITNVNVSEEEGEIKA